MVKRNIKWLLVVLVLGLCPSILHAEDPYGEMKALADSAQKVLGQDRLPSINARWIKLARELNDTVQISDAHNNLISHYYQLGDIDHLKAATYEYMDWCRKYQRTRDRYMAWRQYIQRLTEKGMQEEAMAETVRLHQDAEQARDKYGLACGEMCIGYNHRVFGNNVKLCIENYNNALKLFEEGSYYRDAYVVLLNIIQTYLSRSEYAEAGEYLSKLSQLEDKLDRKQVSIDPSLHLRFCEFRVIGLLANEGRKATEPYIEETDRFYRQHPKSSTPEAWFGYKIMCCRILGDLKGNIAYVDSLMDYQHSLGLCYPYNHYMKGELQEQLGDYRAACRSYARYAAVSDSVRTAEMDDKLSKYTAQFEVDRLKMEKLELSARLNKERLMIALAVGGLVLLLLLLITYLYIRTLSMNRKLEAARRAVEKMSQVKSSFIQHITHEIRTPLNSIVGFSTLLAESDDEEEKKEYLRIIESSNEFLLQLIGDILDISKIESGKMEFIYTTLRLSEIFAPQQQAFALRVAPGVKVIFESDGNDYCIVSEKTRLTQVLTNFLSNAVKFTSSGSIRFGYRLTDDGIYVYVTDTGMGISKESQASIFNRFVKLNSFKQGTGLGLSICKTIIEKLKGKIGVESEEGKGSTFWFTIPCQPMKVK